MSSEKELERICDICGHFLSSKEHAVSCYHCFLCDKKFQKLKLLKQHQKTHDTSIRYQCAFCDKILKNKTTLICHVKNKHTVQTSEWKCDICNAVFGQKFNLNKHKSLHRKKQFNCGICSKSFHYKYNFDQHCKASHTLN